MKESVYSVASLSDLGQLSLDFASRIQCLLRAVLHWNIAIESTEAGTYFSVHPVGAVASQRAVPLLIDGAQLARLSGSSEFVVGEASADQEHSESVVLAVSESAGEASVEFDDPVERLGRAIVGPIRGGSRQGTRLSTASGFVPGGRSRGSGKWRRSGGSWSRSSCPRLGRRLGRRRAGRGSLARKRTLPRGRGWLGSPGGFVPSADRQDAPSRYVGASQSHAPGRLCVPGARWWLAAPAGGPHRGLWFPGRRRETSQGPERRRRPRWHNHTSQPNPQQTQTTL